MRSRLYQLHERGSRTRSGSVGQSRRPPFPANRSSSRKHLSDAFNQKLPGPGSSLIPVRAIFRSRLFCQVLLLLFPGDCYGAQTRSRLKFRDAFRFAGCSGTTQNRVGRAMILRSTVLHYNLSTESSWHVGHFFASWLRYLLSEWRLRSVKGLRLNPSIS